MKLSDLRLDRRPWNPEKSHNAGNWHAVDYVSPGEFNTLGTDVQVRAIYHYSTLMACYYDGVFTPMSLGHGSVSDQQGMNQIARNTGWYFSRRGGAAWRELVG